MMIIIHQASSFTIEPNSLSLSHTTATTAVSYSTPNQKNTLSSSLS